MGNPNQVRSHRLRNLRNNFLIWCDFIEWIHFGNNSSFVILTSYICGKSESSSHKLPDASSSKKYFFFFYFSVILLSESIPLLCSSWLDLIHLLLVKVQFHSILTVICFSSALLIMYMLLLVERFLSVVIFVVWLHTSMQRFGKLSVLGGLG